VGGVCEAILDQNLRQDQQETKTMNKVSQTHNLNLSTAHPPSDDGDGGGDGSGDGGLLLCPATETSAPMTTTALAATLRIVS